MFKKQDLYLIVPFLLVAAVLLIWFGSKPNLGVAVVEKDGAELYRFDLSQQTTTQVIDLGGSYHIKLLLEPGAISFQHSDCHDQICVRTGRLTKPGQVAVCLPAKISVKIVGRQKEFDGYTG